MPDPVKSRRPVKIKITKRTRPKPDPVIERMPDAVRTWDALLAAFEAWQSLYCDPASEAAADRLRRLVASWTKSGRPCESVSIVLAGDGGIFVEWKTPALVQIEIDENGQADVIAWDGAPRMQRILFCERLGDEK